jgi:hypothetical protein
LPTLIHASDRPSIIIRETIRANKVLWRLQNIRPMHDQIANEGRKHQNFPYIHRAEIWTGNQDSREKHLDVRVMEGIHHAAYSTADKKH